MACFTSMRLDTRSPQACELTLMLAGKSKSLRMDSLALLTAALLNRDWAVVRCLVNEIIVDQHSDIQLMQLWLNQHGTTKRSQ